MAGKAQAFSDHLSLEDRKAGYILVELGPKLINRTKEVEPSKMRHGIFHEADDNHPNKGEALVVHGKVVKVFVTPRVREALAHELLVESDKPESLTLDIADAMAATAARQASVLAERDAEIDRLRAELAAALAKTEKTEKAEKTDDKK